MTMWNLHALLRRLGIGDNVRDIDGLSSEGRPSKRILPQQFLVAIRNSGFRSCIPWQMRC
jgi:hypothetical protein